MPGVKAKGERRDNRLLSIIRDAEIACNDRDFLKAESLYTTAIELDDGNPALFGNRSVARVYLHKYEEALSDAKQSLTVDQNYVKGYFRHGVALQCLNQFNSALVAFAKGMALDPKNLKFLQALVDTALKSPLKDSLEPVMRQLKEMNLESNPFVVTSVIGQDLLAHNDALSAVQVLECANSIGTCSLKLKGSVYSALSSALWSLENYDRAIHYMKEDLKVSQALSDTTGECRAYGNLGAANLHQSRLEEALGNHRKQLFIAQKLQHTRLTASAHSGLGLVYFAMGDHKAALQHHESAFEIYTQTHDNLMRCRELGKVSQARLSLGDEQGALRCQKDRLRLCVDDLQDGGREEAQAYSDIAAVYRMMQMQTEEMACLQKSIDLCRQLDDTTNEIKALLSLGYTARHTGDTSVAQSTYERLLEISLQTNNKPLEGRACANLGIVHHQIGDYEMALKLQARCLKIAMDSGDTGGQGRAYGNIGNAYSALGLYEQAVKHHLKELDISNSVGDQESECSTHGNLAVAYQALKIQDRALHHYKCQYELAKQIGNVSNEARSLMNLGNFHNTLNQYSDAIEFYKKYLELIVNAPDKSGEGRALYNLGFACYSLHDYHEAVLCYEKSVVVASDCQDKVAMARAYCNLGLAKKALGEYDAAFDCQNMFLTLSTELKSTRGTFKAFGNLGDIYSAKKETEQAVGFYQRQLALSEQHNDHALTAQACSSLGGALRSIGQLEQAAELHAKEVSIYSSIVKDARNEYKAQGRCGATLTALGRYSEAIICYERQLELSKSNKEPLTEAQAWGNLAITYTNLQEFTTAKESFESQIEILQNLITKSARLEKCRAYCNIGDCCEALEAYKDAISYHQMALSLSNDLRSLSLMERSCKGLSSTFRQLGKINNAITYCQQCLTICERMGKEVHIASTYGELGFMFSTVGKYEDAISCLNQQMRIGVEINDENIKSDAACGLGGVYLLMKEHDKALTFHKLDLEIAQRNNNRPCQGRAYGNIAQVYEAMEDHASAIPCQEQHLFIAKEQNDEEAKLVALHGIGRNSLHLPGTDYSRAVLLLQQAMLLSHGVNNHKEMIMTVHDLGIGMWACGDLQTATVHLAKAVEIAETVCFDIFPHCQLVDEDSPSTDAIKVYKLLTKCYSSLICVLCENGHTQEALDVSEKSKSFPDNMMRNRPDSGGKLQHVSVDRMIQHAVDQQVIVIYYTITAGHMFQWLITPDSELSYSGCVRMLDACDDNNNGNNILTQIIYELRDTLGVEATEADLDLLSDNSSDEGNNSLDNSFYLQALQMQRFCHYNYDHLKTGNGCLLSSSYGKGIENLKGKPPFYALYELLISKVENRLKKFIRQTSLPKLVLVIDGDLVLVPFCMLKKRATDHFLSQNFLLNIVPSFHHILENRHPVDVAHVNYSRGLVMGNPALPEQLQRWGSSHASEEEVNFIGGICRVEPLSGERVNKETVLSKLGSTEIIHFACHSSWKFPVGVVVGTNRYIHQTDIVTDIHKLTNEEDNIEPSPEDDQLDEGNLEDYVLTGTDILTTNLSATKLAVIGSPHLFKSEGGISNMLTLSKSISSLSRCFLAVGSKAVVSSLWPVPETASKLILHTFYKHLLVGRSATSALAVAMETLRGTQQFEHPSYWAGFCLVGQDVRLEQRDISTNHSLCEVVQGHPTYARDAMKLAVHLVEKSSERASSPENDSAVPMYTSQESVSAKLHDTRGWRDLFSAAGFELRSSCNGLPAAIFFPQLGTEDKLQSVASQIKPFLDLSDDILRSFGKLVLSPRTANALCTWIEDTIQHEDPNNVDLIATMRKHKQYKLGRKIWQTDGTSQLLASLGLLVSEMDNDDITLYTRSNLSADTVLTVLETMHLLFGHIDSVFLSTTDLLDKNVEKLFPAKSHMNWHENSLPKTVDGARGIPRGFVPVKSGDLPINIDFNASFHSIVSEGSSHHLESSEHSGHQNDFGILPLEEPKIFTQVPKNTGLIMPTPIMPTKSPNLPSPMRLMSSPGGAFSPSKKFQFATSLGHMLQAKSPSLIRSSNESSPIKSAWSPLAIPSPTQSPLRPTPDPSPGSTFYQGSHNRDSKVCVVNPRLERPATNQPSTEQFMSLFESMLTKEGAPSSRKSSLSRSFEKEFPNKVMPDGTCEDFNEEYENFNEDPIIESPSTSAYKPSPSAASSLRAQSPQYEYTHIVDKLKHTPMSDSTKRYHTISHNRGLTSNTSSSTTHTAFRLVHSNQNEPFSIPKLQKYKVLTQISTVSTLISEDDTQKQSTSNSTTAPCDQANQNDLKQTSAVPKQNSPFAKPSDIFEHLGGLSLNKVDDRVQFV